MANTANWLFLMIGYFTGIVILVGCLSIGGILDDSVDITTNSDINSYSPDSDSINVTIPSSTSVWGIGDIVSDVFGFFTFGVDLGLGSWNWLISLIFVYIPLIIFTMLIYFTIRSGN